MAFDRTTFGPIGGQSSKGKAPASWSYTSADTAATVRVSGYFNDVSDLVSVGDSIEAFLDTGGTPQKYLCWVNSNTGGVVDIPDPLALGTTDTD